MDHKKLSWLLVVTQKSHELVISSSSEVVTIVGSRVESPHPIVKAWSTLSEIVAILKSLVELSLSSQGVVGLGVPVSSLFRVSII